LGMRYKAGFSLDDHVLPVMSNVARATEESVSFYTREGDARSCLFRIDSTRSVRDQHTHAGDLQPLARGPVGKAFVTFGEKKWSRDDIRRLPYLDLGVVYPELASAACPVFAVDGGLLGVLSVSGPKSRFNRDVVARISKTLV